MSIHAHPPGRRALAVSVAAGALAAALALTTDQASAAYTAQVQAGTLHITGDAASDTLALQLGAPGTLQVSVNGVPAFSFDATTFTAIDVKAGAGDDVVSASNGIASLGPLTIDGGTGDDTVGGGDGDDVLIGGPGNDLVDGNRGADTALLGAGADRFQWDPGDGSDTVEGQGGKDVMDFNGSNAPEKIDVSANGSRVRLFRDVAAITMDFAGIESVNVRTLGSADTVTVNDMTGTDLKSANVDLGAFGGGGDGAADTVTVNGTARADRVRVTRSGSQVLTTGLAAQTTIDNSEGVNDTLQINTLDGRDSVTVDPDAELLITPVINLGAGQ